MEPTRIIVTRPGDAGKTQKVVRETTILRCACGKSLVWASGANLCWAAGPNGAMPRLTRNSENAPTLAGKCPKCSSPFAVEAPEQHLPFRVEPASVPKPN